MVDFGDQDEAGTEGTEMTNSSRCVTEDTWRCSDHKLDAECAQKVHLCRAFFFTEACVVTDEQFDA